MLGVSSAIGYLPGTPEYRRVAVGLFLAGVTTFALLHAPQPLLPEFASFFGLSAQQAALAVSFSTLGLGLALLITGPGTEVIGRTPVMFASMFVASAVGVACAFAPSWGWLLVLRFVQGVALAGLPAVATAYIREEVHPGATSRAVGLYIGGTGLGGMSGRLLSGLVADHWGWRAAFAVLGIVCLCVAIAAKVLLPASRNFVPGVRSARSVWTTAVRALTDPALIALYVISGLLMGGFVAVYNAMGFRLAAPPYMLPLSLASLVFVTYIVGTPASTSAGAMADRFGQKRVLPLAIGSGLLGLLITALVPLPLVIIGLAIFTAGFFAAHGVASGWVAIRATERGGGAGQAAALYLFAYYLGSSVFGAVAGFAWTHWAWPGVVVLVGTLWTIALVLALALRFVRRAA